MASPTDVTRILQAVSSGEDGAAARLQSLVYAELHDLARARMARERPDHTLQPTALVHEVYLRLFGDKGSELTSRAHFFSAAAEAMRRILVDHARTKRARKRGGEHKRVDLDDIEGTTEERLDDLLALDEALTKFAEVDPRRSRVVSLKFFAGLPLDRISQITGVSERTLKRDWQYARSWLYRQIQGTEQPP